MSKDSVMVMKRLKGGVGSITKAANHNKRTHGATSADPNLLHLNFTLGGPATAQEVSALARKLMTDAGISKPARKDAVSAIEVVCSLPMNSQVDVALYFEDCVRWVARNFGGELNVLSADVHLDEPEANCPHCHVLVLPLVNGKMNGSDLFGSNARRSSLAKSFHDEVGALYGLQRPAPPLMGASKTAAAQQVLARLEEDADPAVVSRIWTAICAAIARCPEPFMVDLGMVPQPTASPARTFKEIALSRGKGPKTEAAETSRDRKLKTGATTTHVGIGREIDRRTPSCVGIAQEPLDVQTASDAMPESPGAALQPAAPAPTPLPRRLVMLPTQQPMIERTVERDDFPAGEWNSGLGEHRTQQEPQLRAAKAAIVEVAALLERRVRPDDASPSVWGVAA